MTNYEEITLIIAIISLVLTIAVALITYYHWFFKNFFLIGRKSDSRLSVALAIIKLETLPIKTDAEYLSVINAITLHAAMGKFSNEAILELKTLKDLYFLKNISPELAYDQLLAYCLSDEFLKSGGIYYRYVYRVTWRRYQKAQINKEK